ncbi:MAG: phosphatase PAP2 family protein [Coriobacteriales bacterium]|nr:phosphatase PAP2 family protein [Coriobacteriales bacterium]
MGSVLTPLCQVLAYFGDHGIGFIILALVLMCFKKTRTIGICMLVSLLLDYLFANLGLKTLVDRPRPFEQNEQWAEWWTAVGALSPGGSSFPSLHAAMMASYMMIIALSKRTMGWTLGAIALVLLMDFSRAYLVVHHPTDIIVGTIIGIVIGICSYYLVKAVMSKFQYRAAMILE